MANKSVKQWEMELFGNVDKRCAKNMQIMEFMEHIDYKIEFYHLSKMKEKDIKLEAIASYDRLRNSLNSLSDE